MNGNFTLIEDGRSVNEKVVEALCYWLERKRKKDANVSRVAEHYW